MPGGHCDGAQDPCGFSLTSPVHVCYFSICLLTFPPSFVLSPSPLLTCQVRSWPPGRPAHTVLKVVDPSSYPSSFSLTSPALTAGLLLGREPHSPHRIFRLSMQSQSPASHACAPSQGLPPLGPGEHHTPGCDGFPRHLQRAPHLFAMQTLNPALVINVVYFD